MIVNAETWQGDPAELTMTVENDDGPFIAVNLRDPETGAELGGFFVPVLEVGHLFEAFERLRQEWFSENAP